MKIVEKKTPELVAAKDIGIGECFRHAGKLYMMCYWDSTKYNLELSSGKLGPLTDSLVSPVAADIHIL